MLFGDPILKNNFISSIVKGHLDTKKYSFLVDIPSLYGEIYAFLGTLFWKINLSPQ